ncbi:hypothetical protein [Kitasatospora sp. GP82]|uniref:hypothetical protein n=1 Tax=Kitasatospora sp. GP82 TaxID=3035089 RepID=UPI002477298E|nr:hypothetical protein [Kitasatospora sp. GP82]MDH6130536.1 hypothetical protein [Kitasatospora sp. GP82]
MTSVLPVRTPGASLQPPVVYPPGSREAEPVDRPSTMRVAHCLDRCPSVPAEQEQPENNRGSGAGTVCGPRASEVAAMAGIPVALLKGHGGWATVTATTGSPGSDDEMRYVRTEAAYDDEQRVEVFAPQVGTPEEIVAKACPAGRTQPGLLGPAGQHIWGVERSADGRIARAVSYRGWTVLAVTADTDGQGRIPILRFVWGGPEHRGGPGQTIRNLA